MAGTSIECPGDGVLRSLIDSEQPCPELEAHLSECVRCQERLESLSGGLAVDAAIPPGPPTKSAALETVMHELKARPLEARCELDWWLKSVGATATDGDQLGVLDGYELERVIGEGGMGMVLQARDQRLDRPVAIKLIKPTLLGDQSAGERLIREARAAAKIQHDSVVPIYAAEMTSQGSVPFIVMPLVEEGTLQERLDHLDGHLSVEEVITIGRQMAQALAAAHEAGVIHRDVKPGNVLLRGGGKVWVADFGLARVVDDIRLTREGDVAGTPQFMAPEQIEGKRVDHRADLFSLGTVLYAMAVGKAAFTGSSTVAVIRSVADDAHEPAAKANPNLPTWLATLIDRLLEKDPDKRLQSASEVVTVFNERSLKLAPQLSVRWWWLALGAFMVACGIVWMSWKPAWRRAPISIPSEKLGFQTLLVAIAKAQPGAIIELQESGVIHRGVIPEIKKPLTLRAARGALPELFCDDHEGPMILASEPLILEGIRFVSEPPSEYGSYPPIVRTTSSLAIANCAFNRDDGRGKRGALVSLTGAGKGKFVNCVFVSETGPGIGLGEEDSVAIFDNCLIQAGTGMFPKHGEGYAAEVYFSRSAFHGSQWMLWKEKNPLGSIIIHVNDSVIDASSVVLAVPGHRFREIEGLFRFRGERNVYNSNAKGFLSFERGQGRNPQPVTRAEIDSLDAWNRHWELQDSGSEERVLNDKSLSIDERLIGPESYQRFRESPAYQAWQVDVKRPSF